jgi:uncharacterized protein (TIGR03067 family)
LNLTPAAYEAISRDTTGKVMALKGEADLAARRSRVHDLAAVTQAYLKATGAYPPGAMRREAGPDRGLPYRPDERLSWAAALLPHFGEEFREWKVYPNLTWNEGPNLAVAARVIPHLVVPSAKEAGPVQIVYPGMPASQPVGATHFVGISGLGLDAAEYLPGNPETDKKMGIFGYDRVTKESDVKNKDKTILLIMVRNDHKAPWLAGGGATVRAVSDNDEDGKPIAPFVCTTHKGKRGTIAVMADGKVRFIPEDIPAATFRAMCTIAGGPIEKLDEICPIIPNPEDRELKAGGPGGDKTKGPEAPPAGGAEKKAVSGDLEKLQGTWQCVVAIKGGKPAPPEVVPGLRMAFRGNRLFLAEDGRPEKGEGFVRLNSTTSPKQIDVVASEDAKAPLRGGIYDLQGDTLKVCMAEGASQPRPTEFASKPGGKTVYLELKRKK